MAELRAPHNRASSPASAPRDTPAPHRCQLAGHGLFTPEMDAVEMVSALGLALAAILCRHLPPHHACTPPSRAGRPTARELPAGGAAVAAASSGVPASA
jgi:hypothetical protein